MRIALPLISAKSGNDHYFESLAEALQAEGVEADVLRFGYRLEFASWLFAPGARRGLRAYDLVHCAGDYGCLFQVPPRPLVLTLHHNVLVPAYQAQASWPQRLYHQHLLRRRILQGAAQASALVYVSQDGRDSFAGMLAGSTVPNFLVPNVIDTDFFVPAQTRTESAKCRLLFVGSMSRRKGAHLLGPIMQELGPGFELTCVTRTEGQLPEQDNIRICRNVSAQSLRSLYQSADMLLFPTQLEGFGYTVAEAMSAGLPIVSSNNSAIPELVVQGQGGWLCESSNIHQYVQRVRQLCDSPAERARMGAFNRARALEHYAKKNWGKAYKKLYASLLET